MRKQNCNFLSPLCQAGKKKRVGNRFLYSSTLIFQWQKLGCRAIPSMFLVSASTTKGEIFPANALNISFFAKCVLSPHFVLSLWSRGSPSLFNENANGRILQSLISPPCEYKQCLSQADKNRKVHGKGLCSSTAITSPDYTSWLPGASLQC